VGRSLSRIYLDASCIIYLIEAADPFHAVVAVRLAQHGSDPSAVIVTSRLSRLECRTRPLRDGNRSVLDAYDTFFSSNRLVLAEIDRLVIERATGLRAQGGFKTPDAIHLATAIQEEATVFLTGDTELVRARSSTWKSSAPTRGRNRARRPRLRSAPAGPYLLQGVVSWPSLLRLRRAPAVIRPAPPRSTSRRRDSTPSR
jgi:predicted nucleic acid-binding protein